jgi:hypothetical protein
MSKISISRSFPDNVDEAATWYTKRGFWVVPVEQKRPYTPKWQNMRLGLEDLGDYFNGRKQNLGVLLGVP